jgi:hypothetical protein
VLNILIYNNSKHQPYVKPVKTEIELDLGIHQQQTPPENGSPLDHSTLDSDKKETVEPKKVEEVYVEEKEYLLRPYLSQYVVYTGPSQAWLL